MKKTISIFLLIFYVSAQCFLPKGNFAYITQIPQLYIDFCAVNHTEDIFEFFEEQFFEMELNEGESDEPFEKESKSVPFYTPDTAGETAFFRQETTRFINPETSRQKHFVYILKEYSAPVTSVYRPPEAA